MSIKDKEKWDAKYREKEQLLKPRQASKNLQDFIEHCKGTRALDIACGSGRNSIFLAECGFEVDALDIAEVAIKTLKKQVLIAKFIG
jgi:2-polyprenyl-3-methyl-5-hydroxy-6-metoxy-1,4-benzoquinol methylase